MHKYIVLFICFFFNLFLFILVYIEKTNGGIVYRPKRMNRKKWAWHSTDVQESFSWRSAFMRLRHMSEAFLCYYN